MFYIVGLGNPGNKYHSTRHNVGFMMLDSLREKFNLPTLIHEKHNNAFLTEGKVAEKEVKVIYPDAFMNNSGGSVVKFVSKEEINNLIVVHDDIDLPFGQVKVGKGRGDGGNNGVKSIISKLGSKDFIRIRIGIAPTSFWSGEVKRPKGGGALERYVLKPFSSKEEKKLPEIKERAVGALEEILRNGAESAMNKFN